MEALAFHPPTSMDDLVIPLRCACFLLRQIRWAAELLTVVMAKFGLHVNFDVGKTWLHFGWL